MQNNQVFKRKAFHYISKFFVVAAFSFSLWVDLTYGSRELFPGYNVVMAGMIILALAMGIWEVNNPLVVVENNHLTLNLSLIFMGRKNIHLDQVKSVNLNSRKTMMTLSDNEGKDLRIPLNVIQGAANKDRLIDLVNEKVDA